MKARENLIRLSNKMLAPFSSQNNISKHSKGKKEGDFDASFQFDSKNLRIRFPILPLLD